MATENNLYGKEIVLLEMHNGKVFTSTPALENMVQQTEANNLKIKTDFLVRQAKENAKKQHCRVGTTSATWGGLPALQVRAIYKKDYVFISRVVDLVGKKIASWFEQKDMDRVIVKSLTVVGLLSGNDCPGAGVCAPAGQRSRKEWCQHGNLIE